MESRVIGRLQSHARRTRSCVLEPGVQPWAATLPVRNHCDACLARAGVGARHGVPLPARRGRCHPTRWRAIAAVLLGLWVFWGTGCSSKKAESQGMPPGYSVPVTTATATLRTVPIQVHAIGKAEAERYTKLFQEGIVSKEQYDSMRTNADALAASVRADEAAIEKARIDLSYCTLQAPIDGRTGALLVHPGNLVKDNDAVLVVVNQIHPIYVTFSVPEQNLADIKRYRAGGPLKVEAIIPSQEQNPARGVLTFIDNAVDNTTGTIKLKGTFENPDNRLWPGQFVNVALTLTTQPNAVVAPSQAVQTGQV